MTNYDEIVTSCARCGKYLTEKDKIYSAYNDGLYEPYCSYECVIKDYPWLKDSAKKFFRNENMNDREFGQKCRKIIYQQLKELDKFLNSNKDYGFDPNVAKSVALLYLTASIPNSSHKKKKSCKFCKNIKSKEFRIRISYKGTNNDITAMEDVTNIKYCPLCGRKIKGVQ